MNEADKKLNDLYSERKRKTTAPLKIQQKLTKAAALNINQKGIASYWTQYFRYAGMVTACIGIFALALLQSSNLSLLEEEQWLGTEVQLHILASEAVSVSSRQRIEYQKAQQAFQTRQRLFAEHHQQKGHLIASDHGWQLKMCDASTIAISPSLLAELRKSNVVDMSIDEGEFVHIAFNSLGQILSIRAESQSQRC